MIASVQKQNQTQPTGNTSTVGQNPVMDSKFTRAEVGQQGLARSIDRKMNEMNARKSEVSKYSLREVLMKGAPIASEDRSFSSTNNVDQVPQKVRDILEFHEISFSEGDRIVHIPGANYFHFLHYNGDQKEFTMFSLDEELHAPTTDEADVVIAPPVRDGVARSDEGVGVEPTLNTPDRIPTNTLGTLGYQPEPMAAVVSSEDAPEREPAFITEMKPEPVVEVATTPETPIQIAQKNVDTKRAASSREFGPYHVNLYRDRVSGSFNELFGNNTKIQDSLFKTIRDYDVARHDYLIEFAKTKPQTSAVMDWIRKEHVQLSLLLTHDRLHLYTELAHIFHIATSNTLETRNRVISTMPSRGKITPVAEKLGIHGVLNPLQPWEILFAHHQEKQLPVSRVIFPNTSMPSPIQENSAGVVSVPEHVINKRTLYDKVLPFLKTNFNLGQIILQKPMVPVQPEVESAPVAVPGKQHPEQLFA